MARAGRTVNGRDRFAGEKFFCNARMQMPHIRRHCRVDADGQALLKQAMESLGLSARAYTKILKVGRTIADLEGAASIQPHHITEAIDYRTRDRALEGATCPRCWCQCLC